MLLVLALTACTGQESKQRNGIPPMTTEEKEVYAAYEAINNAMIKKDRVAMGATEKGSILEKLVLFMPKNAKKTH